MGCYRSRSTCLQSLRIALPRGKMWAEPVTSPRAPRESTAFHGERLWLFYGFSRQVSSGVRQPATPGDSWLCFPLLCTLDSACCAGIEWGWMPHTQPVIPEASFSVPSTLYWRSNGFLALVQGQKQSVYGGGFGDCYLGIYPLPYYLWKLWSGFSWQ